MPLCSGMGADNVHIHIAAVQVEPTRTRGMLKPKTLDNMKSKVYNTVVDRSNEYKKISNQLRDKIVNPKNDISSFDNKKICKLFLKIHEELPSNKKLWTYKMNGINKVRPMVDELTNLYINTYFKKEFRDFKQMLDKEEHFIKETFGDSDDQTKDKRFSKNKMEDLYYRFGNKIFKELKEYDKNLKQAKFHNEKLLRKSKHINNSIYSLSRQSKIRSEIALNKALYQLKKSLKDDFDSIKNQNDYEKLMKLIEYEKGDDYE